MKDNLIKKCRELMEAYQKGKLGNCIMPEDANPGFKDNEKEERLAYFTLPMSLNYQRDSYKLWQATLMTYNDGETKDVFEIKRVVKMSADELRIKLMRYKLALQPNKHINTWKKISETIFDNWGNLGNLFKEANYDQKIIKEIIEQKYKKGFPYLSGPKIFNYWSLVMSTYGQISLKNKQLIEIAPDTHVTKCSVRLGVISDEEAEKLSREEISTRWREVLENSGISPIEMHPPLWFWSRNGFKYKLQTR